MTPEDDPNDAEAHCPNCGAEYREGFDTCADCGSKLLPGPAPVAADPEAPPPDAWEAATERAWSDRGADEDEDRDHPEPVVLCRLAEEEAHMLEGRLRAEGIEAMCSPESTSGYISPYVRLTQGGRVEVLVRRSHLEDAVKVVHAVFEGRLAI